MEGLLEFMGSTVSGRLGEAPFRFQGIHHLGRVLRDEPTMVEQQMFLLSNVDSRNPPDRLNFRD